ncbi:MAG: site-specific integrase [Barnesiella intestinihominis]
MPIESFLEYIRYEKNLSTHTVLSYRNDLFQFKKFLETECDGIEMQKVTSDCIREWVALLSEGGMSARSICRKISSLRAFYRYLVVQSDIQESPVKNIPLPKVHKKMPVYLRQDSMNELLDDVSYGEGFEAVRNKLIIAMLYHTGMRRAELIGLRDTDVREGEIKVTGKRNKQRLIPYGEELSQMIVVIGRLVKSRGDDCGFSFGKMGTVISAVSLSGSHGSLSKVCSLDKEVRMYCVIHASAMLNNGATLNSVKELLDIIH